MGILVVNGEIQKIKTLGRCPKPHKLLKKFDQNFVSKRVRACKKSGQARCACRVWAESPQF